MANENSAPETALNAAATPRTTAVEPPTPRMAEFRASTAKRALRAATGNQEPALAAKWNEALCCEARNSLQVILSGAEILAEDHFGNLQATQKALLNKMTDNAYHLCHLLATLAGPDEFKSEKIAEDDISALPQLQAR